MPFLENVCFLLNLLTEVLAVKSFLSLVYFGSLLFSFFLFSQNSWIIERNSWRSFSIYLTSVGRCSFPINWIAQSFKSNILDIVRYPQKNYRPIIILPVISENFEKILSKKLKLFPDQKLFKKRLQCLTSLVAILGKWKLQLIIIKYL